MAALSSHANVFNTCLRILRTRGWVLALDGEEDADLAACSWRAEKGGYDLHADNPIELLGLATIYDVRAPREPPRPYWWTVPGDDIVDELVTARWPE